MNLKMIAGLFLLCLLLLIFAGCAPGSGSNSPENPAGFFKGVWHGWIAPVSLVWGIFNPQIRIYEPYNKGWFYDFGFYIAIIGGFGGIAIFRRSREDKD